MSADVAVKKTASPQPEKAKDEAVSAPEEYVAPKGVDPGEDVERLVPDPLAPFQLHGGQWVTAQPLRLREFLSLLKIVTRGAAMAMGSVRLNTNDEDFMQSIISLFIFAIPEAEEEACDFLRIMVKPVVTGTDEERVAAQIEIDLALENPELEDLFTIIEVVIRRDGQDLRSLGKRLSKAMEFAQKTGQS